MIILAFWGLTRSLRYTHTSIQKNIIQVLKQRQLPFKIIMHTYTTSTYTNTRAEEYDIELPSEHHLLQPDEIMIDDQDTIQEQLQLSRYRTHPDPWNTNYQTMDNFILAMYSKLKLTQMISKYSPSTVIFLRPDVLYLQPLPDITSHPISIPSFHLHSNFNDRFAICNAQTYRIYGSIFNILYTYSLHYKLHSETCYAHYLQNIPIHYIHFVFCRVRATGRIDPKDIPLLKKQIYNNKDNNRYPPTRRFSWIV